jgi:hypothetical protein
MTLRRVLLVVVTLMLLAGCSRLRPTVAPMAPTLSSSDTETLPPDAWFSIQATGRVSPSFSDILIVYQNGLAVYTDQSSGKQFKKQFDEKDKTRWQGLFVTRAKFASLEDEYPATTPTPDDATHYVFRYRQDDMVKTVKAQKSGAPPELQVIIREFWSLVETIQLTD